MSDGNGLWMPTRRGLMAAGGMGLMAAALPGWAADEAGTPLYRAAREAWLYALPLVQIGGYRARQMAKGNRPNVLVYQDSLSTPASRDVTTPNVDTLYAGALIDLGAGPVTLTLPPTGKRYASVALMDFWSNNFAVLGTRTTGPDGGRFTLVGPEGAARAGALRSPTRWAWMIVRLVVDGPPDMAAATALLHRFALEAPAVSVPTLRTAPFTAPWAEYFATAQALMLENPPPATDAAVLGRIAPLGLARGGGFDVARFSATDVAEIERGVADARAWCRKAGLGEGRNGDWIYQAHDTGDFGQDYDYRARIALSGLAALPETEAMYLTALDPAGSPYFDATQAWRLHFPTNSLPPVDAFWSLTLYEESGDGRFFLTDNSVNRYAIGDRTPALSRGSDGSLDIAIQRAEPGGALSGNWLPAPASAARFILLMRAYLPGKPMIDRRYVLPPVLPA